MKKYYSIYIILFALLLIVGCSTRKDAFLNRSFHQVTTKYNILYNGQVAFDKGIEELFYNYKDNYRERLLIERLKVSELAIPGVEGSSGNSNASFEKAEEKAVKAVQKHSMNISGKERNSQIDDAFLLLGKSRYYSQRFVPAVESFNYVIKNYPKADLISETKIWQAKSYLRLQNEELALESLKKMLKTKELLDDEIVEKAHTAIAMVYTVMDSTDQVHYHLKQSVLTNFDKEQTARNTFILGQIYRERNEIDSSNIAFQKVINMKKVPYRYRIHAEIEIAKNMSDNTDTEVLIETLNKLIAARENRPYLDELHYHTGLIHKKLGRIDLAEEHFIASAHARDAQQFQIGLAYEELGNLQFNKANYVAAGSYYDSVLQIPQNRNTKRIRRLERKRKNLEEVIYFEKVTQVTDSVLWVVSMSKEEQVAFFQDYIDELKAIDEAALQKNINSGFGSFIDTNKDKSSGKGKWYFYNTQVVGFGAQEFQQVWGNRPLEDNWRLSDKSVLSIAGAADEVFGVAEIEDSEKFDIDTYLNRIPTEQREIDSISGERNEAYYQLGLIYKEQFKQYDIASNKFEDLLSFSPDEKYILPTKYHLYKCYIEFNTIKADKLKEDIVSRYPDSKYTQLILHPEMILASENDENSPENIYKNVYYAYQDAKYDEVITQTEIAIGKYKALSILPKFELLRAYALGKRDGLEAFRVALEYVALNYSNTEEGKKAAEVIETINKL